MSPNDTDPTGPRDSRWLRFAIVAFCLVLLFTIVASIHLSTLDISFGTLVYGPATVWRGHEAGFRVVAYDPRGVDLVGPIRATFTLQDQNTRYEPVAAAGRSLAEARVTIPPGATCPCTLTVAVETPQGDDMVSAPVQVVDMPPPLVGRIAPHSEVWAKHQEPRTGPFAVAIYPDAGRLISGLENTVLGRITRDGQPVTTELSSNPFGIHTESDPYGLFRFPLTPIPQTSALSFRVGPSGANEISLPFEVEPAGLVLNVQPAAFLTPGQSINVTIRTLPFRDPVLIDVWAGTCLLAAVSNVVDQGSLSMQVVIPGDLTGFLRVESYRNLAAPEDTRNTAVRWVSNQPPAMAVGQILDALSQLPGGDPALDWARAAPDEAQAMLTRMVLSRYVPNEAGLPLLRSTLETRQSTLSTKRTDQRTTVHTLFVLTVVLGLGLAVAWVLRHQMRVRRAMRQVVEEGIAAGEPIDTENVHRLARINHLYDLLLALGALVLIAYGIFILLTRMTWE